MHAIINAPVAGSFLNAVLGAVETVFGKTSVVARRLGKAMQDAAIRSAQERAIYELQGLSDRELNDLGIGRSEIRARVMGAAE